MLAELNRHEQMMLTFAERHHQSNSLPPTLREIGQAVGLKSKDHVSRDVKGLEEKRYIHKTPRVSRGIEILFTVEGHPYYGTTRQLPVCGAIAAGQPIPIPDENRNPHDMVELPRKMAPKNEDRIYALRGQGNSMTDALISDGDIVLRRHQEAILDGDGQMLAVWLRDTGKTTLKKAYHEGECIRLQPANPKMKALCVSPDTVQIQGKVIGLRRQME